MDFSIVLSIIPVSLIMFFENIMFDMAEFSVILCVTPDYIRSYICTVAPRAGAWIETFTTLDIHTLTILSRPARARGLKRQ